MAEKVDGWMPLHVGPYLAATRHLSSAEHGMYLLLLMHAWNHGGMIPGDDEQQRRISAATPKEWAKSRAVVLSFLDKQEDGAYRQKRLAAELAKAQGLKAERASAGAIGAQKRWQTHSKAMAEPVATGMANECPIPVPKPENQNSPPSPPPGGVSVDKSKANGRWWLTPEGIAAEGRRLGVDARSGESYGAYAQRIREARAA